MHVYKLKLSNIIFHSQVFHSMFDSNAPIFTLIACRLGSCPVYLWYCNVMDGGNREECLPIEEKAGGYDVMSGMVETMKNVCVLHIEEKAGGYFPSRPLC